MELRDRIESITEANKNTFYQYLKLESVSAQGREINETAEFAKKMIEQQGGYAEVLTLPDKPEAHPVVYGEFKAGKNSESSKTLLFYNHYDVQPEDPIDEWKTVPFEPVEKDEKIYCRGVSDNKANLFARLNAIAAIKETSGELPINIKFLIEGEEEIGSVHIDEYLKAYQDKFAADVCIWESGSKDSEDRIVLSAGIKGIAYFDAKVKTADIDIHSSQAAIIDNAAWRLVHALASMRDKDNKIIVDGFYDLMEEPNDTERDYLKQMPHDPEVYRENYGLKTPFITDTLDYSQKEALVFYPTLTISGLDSGYKGKGAKTVLPKEAKAKIDVRLVPGYMPEKVQELLRNHLDKQGYEDVELDLVASVKPFRTDLNDPFVDLMVRTGEEVYGEGKAVITPNSPGTGPMHGFGEYLNLPVISTGSEYYKSGAHAPNEHIRWNDFYQNIEHLIRIIEELAV